MFCLLCYLSLVCLLLIFLVTMLTDRIMSHANWLITRARLITSTRYNCLIRLCLWAEVNVAHVCFSIVTVWPGPCSFFSEFIGWAPLPGGCLESSAGRPSWTKLQVKWLTWISALDICHLRFESQNYGTWRPQVAFLKLWNVCSISDPFILQKYRGFSLSSAETQMQADK